MTARLDAGDRSFLKDVSPERAGEALTLGSGAAFYLSVHAMNDGNPDLAEAFLTAEWEHGTGIWKREAGRRLLAFYDGQSKWEPCLPFVKVYATEYPDDYYSGLILIRALTETGRESLAQDEILRFKTRFGASLKVEDGLALEFITVKALAQAGDPAWQDRAIRLALSRIKEAPVLDTITLLMADETRLRNIPETTRTYLELRALVARKDYRGAMKIADSAKGFLAAENLPDSVLADAGKAWLYGGGATPGRTQLKAFLARKPFNPELAYTAQFYIARFEKELKLHEESVHSFERAVSLAVDPTQRDAALWYLFDAISVRGPSAVIGTIALYAESIANHAFFSDILDRLCVELAQNHDFASIDALRAAVSFHASPQIQARLSYISGRAAEMGFIKGGMETAKKRYREALSHENQSYYYRFLSSIRLGEPIALTGESVSYQSPNTLKPAETRGETEQFLDGFLAFGLAKNLFREALPRINDLSAASVRRYASLVTAKAQFADSIRFISQLFEREGFNPSQEDLELGYPRPFLAEIRGAAGEFNIPEYILLGLIRTESAFIPDIVSRAGAVGLSQLMQPTAEQAAKTMGLVSWSSTNPDDNVRIGAYYLDYLNSRLHRNIMHALFAYNGGINRVKRWVSAHATLPDDLFLETVPLEETRGYGRKVLAAAAVYGYLYYGLTPDAIAREISGNDK